MEDFLVLDALSKSFGGVRAVDDVSLRHGDGDMRAIIGPNGCGKTTLFNLITGYLAPDHGSIRFEGQALSGLALHQVARRGIVRKFQVPSVFDGLSAGDNLRAALAAPIAGRGRPLLNELLERVGLAGHERKDAGLLSHGQKQWLELALVLAASPKLVLLDEPAAGMTKAERAETVKLLHRLRGETGLSIMLIEHDMDFVAALDCPVSVMMLGRIVAEGSFSEVRRDPAVREAYLGAGYA